MQLIRGVLGHRKNFLKKRAEIHFSILIENPNWDFKFVFQFDNENKKRKKLKILFHFKSKIDCSFRPTDWIGLFVFSFSFFSSIIKCEKWNIFFEISFFIANQKMDYEIVILICDFNYVLYCRVTQQHSQNTRACR